jgi:hypothetical protein
MYFYCIVPLHRSSALQCFQFFDFNCISRLLGIEVSWCRWVVKIYTKMPHETVRIHCNICNIRYFSMERRIRFLKIAKKQNKTLCFMGYSYLLHANALLWFFLIKGTIKMYSCLFTSVVLTNSNHAYWCLRYWTTGAIGWLLRKTLVQKWKNAQVIVVYKISFCCYIYPTEFWEKTRWGWAYRCKLKSRYINWRTIKKFHKDTTAICILFNSYGAEMELSWKWREKTVKLK